MQRTTIKDIARHGGETVRICGWIQTLRSQKRMQFLVIRDQSGSAQLVHEKASNAELASVIEELTTESAVEIVGKVILNPAVKLGGIEVSIESIVVVSKAETPLPIGESPTLETRMDWRFLDLRTPHAHLLEIGGVHRNAFPEIHGERKRIRCGTFPCRVFRPSRLSCPKPAVLQADGDGSRIR